jgi:hypothetical protein
MSIDLLLCGHSAAPAFARNVIFKFQWLSNRHRSKHDTATISLTHFIAFSFSFQINDVGACVHCAASRKE